MGISLPNVLSNGLNIHVGCHSTTECDLHAMDEQEKWSSKGSATCEGYDIPDMDSKLIEISLNATSSCDASNTGEISEGKLV